MSKFILWLGFLFSIALLTEGLFFASSVKPAVLLFWIAIFIGSGYKLFFNQKAK